MKIILWNRKSKLSTPQNIKVASMMANIWFKVQKEGLSSRHSGHIHSYLDLIYSNSQCPATNCADLLLIYKSSCKVGVSISFVLFIFFIVVSPSSYNQSIDRDGCAWTSSLRLISKRHTPSDMVTLPASVTHCHDQICFTFVCDCCPCNITQLSWVRDAVWV